MIAKMAEKVSTITRAQNIITNLWYKYPCCAAAVQNTAYNMAHIFYCRSPQI